VSVVAVSEARDEAFRFSASMTASLMNCWVKRPVRVTDLYRSTVRREEEDKDFASMSPRERAEALKQLHGKLDRQREIKRVESKKPAAEKMQAKRSRKREARLNGGRDRRGSET
jgi:hypothetical protein